MEDDIYELWGSLVQKHTKGGACNFQNAAIELVELTEQKEREACAKVCYELPWKDMTAIPSNLAFADAIRARGKA